MADINNDSTPKEEQKDESTSVPASTNSDEKVKDEKETKEDVKQDDTKNENSGEEEEGSEDEKDEELPPGLLEQPLEVSGKREKRKVDRLSATMTVAQSAEKKKTEIEEGSGTKLGDIAFIENQLNSTKAADLKSLHRLLFLRIGTQHEVKKNIRQFCGFAQPKESKDHERRMAQLNKMHLAELKPICQVLALEKSGTKKDIVDRIMDFLMQPVDKGMKVPQSKRAKKMAMAKAKNEKDKGKKRKRAPKQSKKKAKNEEEDDEDDDAEGDDAEGDDADSDEIEESLSEQEIEESEDEAPKKKKPKVEPIKEPKKKKASPKASPKVNGKKEKSPKKKEPKKAPPKEMSDLSDDSDSDDEPIAKLIKPSPPSNDEIKGLVKKILDGADLESVTMKTVVKEVYGKYPTFDLSDRKDFIKSTVREVIS